MLHLVYLIPLFPLISWAIIGLANRALPKSVVSLLACGSVLGSFALAVMIFLEIRHIPTSQTVTLFDWISTSNFSASMSFLIDRLSMVFTLVITGVGFLIHLYSTGYMHDDDGYRRFFAYLNLFVFFMLLLVLGNNFLVMFIGWEGVGLCSYLLIGYWFKNIEYSSAAKKAFVMNRIGDLGLLLGVLMIYTTVGSINFEAVFADNSLAKFTPSVATAACILLFIGAMGKSAQIPLFTWLPDAMAGPTPVSALIHAATMVTAGIYMVARCSALYALSPVAMDVVAWTGTITALFAATIGFMQMDIKKILAYSTVSQLGFMFAALGVGAFSAGVFHVVTHAFFKALLFLGAGSVIHAMHHEQDIRMMGGLRKYLPITFITFTIGYLAIIGFPFLAGYFSKDLIIIKALEHKPIIGYLLIAGALMTAFYMSRLYFLTFWGSFRGTHEQEHHLHESPLSMTLPLMVLAILAAIGGFGLEHFMTTELNLADVKSEDNHALHTLMYGVTGFILVGVGYLFYTYHNQNRQPLKDEDIQGVNRLWYEKYYVDEIYDAVITRPLNVVSNFFSDLFDTKILDGVVNSIGMTVRWLSSMIRTTQTGSVGVYFFAMVISIVLILIYKLL